jgi:7-alpha-hydroxysteroid dehydrogenase
MFSLAGKSCVVTGASRGLGRAIALAFAEQGADVVLAARSVPDLDSLRAEIERTGRRAVVAPTDVTDVGQLRALAETAVARFGRLDVWVNNAGGDASIPGGWAEWLDVTEDGWWASRPTWPRPPSTSPPTRPSGCRARCCWSPEAPS